ncbi:hypothetical protein GP486_006168, partial [Trichoglossum hirsutum]
MPTKKWIDKKKATTFALVHRPQNDPKIHDEDAPDMVFKEVAPPNQKIKRKSDLEEELKLDPSLVRANEGEAALHGIYYDDTSYDYMQHMRDWGKSTEAYFVEAPLTTQKQKAKGKRKLEDALRNIHIEEGPSPAKPLLLDEDILPSRNLRKITYQDQQDTPDVIGGFQPDMDPRLRETLVALEDDTYIDNNEEMFSKLVGDGVEVPLEEFVDDGEDEDRDWDSDDTAGPEDHEMTSVSDELNKKVVSFLENIEDTDMTTEGTSQRKGDRVAEFSKLEKTGVAKTEQPSASSSERQPSLVTENSRRRRRCRKRGDASISNLTASGALTLKSASTVPRSEGLRLLDARFEKVLREYKEEPDEDPLDSPGKPLDSKEVEDMAREFLDSWKAAGTGRKKRILRVKNQTGMEELDEI